MGEVRGLMNPESTMLGRGFRPPLHTSDDLLAPPLCAYRSCMGKRDGKHGTAP